LSETARVHQVVRRRDPRLAVGGARAAAGDAALEHIELMAKNQDLCLTPRAGPQ